MATSRRNQNKIKSLILGKRPIVTRYTVVKRKVKGDKFSNIKAHRRLYTL
jgi:hypothetical protein